MYAQLSAWHEREKERRRGRKERKERRRREGGVEEECVLCEHSVAPLCSLCMAF